MKKIKRISYIVLIAIILVLAFSIYTSASKEVGEEDKKEKTFAEIKYVESKIVDLLNSINNIETRNYRVSTSEISEQSSQNSSQNSEGESGSGGSQSSEVGGESSGEGSSSSSGESAGSSSGSENESGSGSSNGGTAANTGNKKEEEKKFTMELSGVLTNNEEIDWNTIKGEIEILYSSIPTMTLDLYQLQSNQEDILNFNQEFDTLMLSAKNENKEETLGSLSKLYEKLPTFLEKTTEEILYKTLVEAKSEIFKAYSKLNSNNWEEIKNDIAVGIEKYNKLLSDTTIENSKQYGISKGYILINELQNAVNTEDVSVFLVKYKNLIEEIDNI